MQLSIITQNTTLYPYESSLESGKRTILRVSSVQGKSWWWSLGIIHTRSQKVGESSI